MHLSYAQKWSKLKITVQKKPQITNIYLLSSSQAATNISAAVHEAISGYHSGLKIVFLVKLVLAPRKSVLDQLTTCIKYAYARIRKALPV